jgi:hypothetical protein
VINYSHHTLFAIGSNTSCQTHFAIAGKSLDFFFMCSTNWNKSHMVLFDHHISPSKRSGNDVLAVATSQGLFLSLCKTHHCFEDQALSQQSPLEHFLKWYAIFNFLTR